MVCAAANGSCSLGGALLIRHTLRHCFHDLCCPQLGATTARVIQCWLCSWRFKRNQIRPLAERHGKLLPEHVDFLEKIAFRQVTGGHALLSTPYTSPSYLKKHRSLMRCTQLETLITNPACGTPK